jgi:hypothetical protein
MSLSRRRYTECLRSSATRWVPPEFIDGKTMHEINPYKMMESEMPTGCDDTIYTYHKNVVRIVAPETGQNVLAWHALGSGKTVLGWLIVADHLLSVSESTDKKIYIVVPSEHDKSNWKYIYDRIARIHPIFISLTAELLKHKKHTKPFTTKKNAKAGLFKHVHIYTFTEFANFYKRDKAALIIVDEAHLLFDVMEENEHKKQTGKQKFLDVMENLDHGKTQVVLLTATPFHSDQSMIFKLLKILDPSLPLKSLMNMPTQSTQKEWVTKLRPLLFPMISFLDIRSNPAIFPTVTYDDLYINVSDTTLLTTLVHKQRRFSSYGLRPKTDISSAWDLENTEVRD